MLHRRYSHGHSAILGFVLALALERHTLTLVLLAVVLGVVIGRAWSFWSDAARALRLRLTRTPRARPGMLRKVSAQDRDGVPY